MFIALVKPDAARVQVCAVRPDSETAASHWNNRPLPAYVGTFAEDPVNAARQAAIVAGTEPDNIVLHALTVAVVHEV